MDASTNKEEKQGSESDDEYQHQAPHHDTYVPHLNIDSDSTVNIANVAIGLLPESQSAAANQSAAVASLAHISSLANITDGIIYGPRTKGPISPTLLNLYNNGVINIVAYLSMGVDTDKWVHARKKHRDYQKGLVDTPIHAATQQLIACQLFDDLHSLEYHDKEISIYMEVCPIGHDNLEPTARAAVELAIEWLDEEKKIKKEGTLYTDDCLFYPKNVRIVVVEEVMIGEEEEPSYNVVDGGEEMLSFQSRIRTGTRNLNVEHETSGKSSNFNQLKQELDRLKQDYATRKKSWTISLKDHNPGGEIISLSTGSIIGSQKRRDGAPQCAVLACTSKEAQIYQRTHRPRPLWKKWCPAWNQCMTGPFRTYMNWRSRGMHTKSISTFSSESLTMVKTIEVRLPLIDCFGSVEHICFALFVLFYALCAQAKLTVNAIFLNCSGESGTETPTCE